VGANAVSHLVEPDPVLRVCSCITGAPELLAAVETELVREFGEIALKSEPFAFDCTRYYCAEMGEGLQRWWYAFRELCPPELLPEDRRITGRIEENFAVADRRRVNLDPGYLDKGKLVLASHKGAADKIYMGRGVWAHTCLRFRFGAFVAPDHSFPDFRDGRFFPFFEAARRLLKLGVTS